VVLCGLARDAVEKNGGFKAVPSPETASSRQVSECGQTCADGSTLDGSSAGHPATRRESVPENATGWNYTGWTPSDIRVLRNRGIDVEILPREVVVKERENKDADGTPLG